MAAPAPADGLPTPARYWAMAVILLGIAISVLDATVVNLALPGIARDLQRPASDAIWIVNAYQLGVLTLLLPCAKLGDLLGYRKVYLWGLAVLLLGSLGCVLADSMGMLVASRAVQGMGAAGVMGVNSALVRLTYPRAMLGRGIAINSMTVAVASVAGPSVAAAVLSVASWPWLFAINLPLAGALLVLGARALPSNPPGPQKADGLSLLDVLLNAAMFALIFLGVDTLGTRAGAPGGASAMAMAAALLLAGLAIGVVYVRRQLGQAVPLFPVDLLRIRIFALSMCSSVTAFAAQMLSNIALPFLLLEGYGRSHVDTGLLITAWPLGSIVTAPIAGRLIGRVPAGLLGAIGMWTMACGLALLAMLPAAPHNADIAWRMALCGIGFALFQSPNNYTIVTSAPPHRAGGASGMLGTARLTGQSIGAVLLAIVFSVPALQAGHGAGAKIALGMAAALATCAGMFSLLRVQRSA
ncbi:MFS transporter [Pseudorhodoferax sp. Leaf267]|uniref:MFS transporter n=1 Tax=Pseudorhodoferax sp. Leaf267 TaxID=1736316 RepID=UPI0006F5F402|nr:MFS transporter [Pseudorhodoferax sp. Leaf267]KQP17687.1 multidrug MFS transporter [Pseudorhodoferax sp. Leaf267]